MRPEDPHWPLVAMLVLTQLSAPPSAHLDALIRLGDGNLQLAGTATPGLAYSVLANTNLAATNWINVGTTLIHRSRLSGSFSAYSR